MGLLVILYQKTSKENDRLNFSFVAAITFASILAVFLVGPMQRKSNDELVEEMMQEMNMDQADETNSKVGDSVTVNVEKLEPSVTSDPKLVKESKSETVEEKPIVDEPKAKKSGFASQFGDIDKGRKILCFFAPGCDHCRETAKALTEMASKDPNFPEMKIVFMDEEAELIPDFFAFAGKKYPFKILDVASFWTVLGGTKDTPGVFYLWNGNIVKEYDGINERAFKKDEFKKIVQKKWAELK